MTSQAWCSIRMFKIKRTDCLKNVIFREAGEGKKNLKLLRKMGYFNWKHSETWLPNWLVMEKINEKEGKMNWED